MGAVVFHQICIMFLLVAGGAVLFKTGWLSDQGGKDLGTILLKFILPCIIVKSYIRDYEGVGPLALSTFLALLALLLAMAVAALAYGTRRRLENFGVAFCNIGFMGVPLVLAALGEKAVFHLAPFVALLNIFQWTYGVVVLTGRREEARWRVVASNPVVLAFVLGMLLYLLRVPVPKVALNALDSVGAMNTPVAMMILGTYVAQVPLREMFLSPGAYVCSFVRLLLAPAVTLAAFYLLPFGEAEMKQAIFIGACAPIGVNVAIFAKLYGGDYKFSAVLVCLSTLFSIAAMPALCALAERIL